MWPAGRDIPDAASKRQRRRANGANGPDIILPSLSLPPAPWINAQRREPRWIDREDVRTNAQYAGGALIGAWALRRLLCALRGPSTSATTRRQRRRGRDATPRQNVGLIPTLLGALAGAACVYRARGGDLQAKARELRAAAADRLREEERAVESAARAAERQVRAALNEAERELVPALRAEAEEGRRVMERSMREVDRAMQQAAGAVEAEVAAASERGRRRRRQAGRGGGG